MRKLIQKTVWVSKVTCNSCKVTNEFWHLGMDSKKEAMADIPSGGLWNGWTFKNKKHYCFYCTQMINALP